MYRAPLREMRFVLEELLGAGRLAACAPFAEYSDELGRSVLEEAARFAQDVLDPLNRPGDVEGARWTPNGVLAPPGAHRYLGRRTWLGGSSHNFGRPRRHRP